MAEMLGSAVAQEIVSGAFSFMRNNHEEMAAQSHLIERLKYAHFELMFALERTKRMPMIEVSLLQRRMMIKHAFKESRDFLHKQHTQRINLEDEGAEQGVTLSHSLPNRIMHAVRPFFGTEKGSISESCVRRFELFAEKTDKFLRDIESGFSLALYRFSCPLITQLLEGKCLRYGMVSGSQSSTLSIYPCCVEDYGVLANLFLEFKDVKTPMKYFTLYLILRLSESTDIVGISTKCLQSLEPQFKDVADVASGELAQISIQVSVFRPKPAQRESVFDLTTYYSRSYRQDPLCCIGDGFHTSAKNFLSSELTKRFPEQVSYLRFQCLTSPAEYNWLSETNRNAMKAWPILHLSVDFLPHVSWKTKDDKVCTNSAISRGQFCGHVGCLDLSEMAKFVPVQAGYLFELEPERKEYTMLWRSTHDLTVLKPTTKIGCAPKIGDGSQTRRVSKRKR